MFELEKLEKGFIETIPTPEIFLYHKGITFVMRSEDYKRDKDLFYVYFIMKFHPDRKKLLDALKEFKNDDYFHAFKQNIKKYLLKTTSPGYLMLRPFLRSWIKESEINREIHNTFKGLFEVL